MKQKQLFKNIFSTFKNKFCVLFYLVFLVFSAIVPTISLFSSDYSFDRFCNKIGRYNSTLEECPPTIKVETATDSTPALYDDLYSYFSYDLYNLGCSRFFNETPTIFDNANNELTSNLKFVFEKVFFPTDSISNDGSIRMSTIDYYCYFSLADLSGFSFYQPKFGADGFVFISDIFAETILENHPNSTRYDILTNESLSLLSLKNKDGETIKVSINNIIDTKQLLASCNLKLADDFCLIYPSSQVLNFFETSSLFIYSRGGINGYKASFDYIKTCGYFSNNTTISILTFNQLTERFTYSDSLSSLLSKCIDDVTARQINKLAILLIYLFTSAVFIFLCFIFKKTIKKNAFSIVIVLSLIFCLSTIPTFFMYFYYWWLAPLITNLLIFIFLIIIPLFIESDYVSSIYFVKRRRIDFDEIYI